MNKPRSRLWSDLTWPEIAALDPEITVAVLPVAATEQHGPHLPLSVDAVINAGIVERAFAQLADDVAALRLPPLPIGYSAEHAAFPGTLSLSPTTLQNLWLDVGRSVRRAGLRKLVIFNSHGGQPQVAQIVARELRVSDGMMVVVANSYGLSDWPAQWPEDERRHGIHGGASETAQILYLQSDLVRRDKIARFPNAALAVERHYRELRLEGEVSTSWQTQDLNPQGACGDATLANADAGRAIVEQAAARLAQLMCEVSAYPLANLRPGPESA